MGCFSSKVMTRSVSVRDELNQSLQRRTHGIPGLEELFTSANGKDRFLTSICTANSVPKELQGVEEQGVRNQAVQPADSLLLSPLTTAVGAIDDIKKARRSKSYQWMPENELSILIPWIDKLNADEFNWENKGITRCRSFHTVEEYDAMVEKKLLLKEGRTFFEDYNQSVTKMPLQHAKSSTENTHQSKHDDNSIQEIAKPVSSDEGSFRETAVPEESSVPLASGLKNEELVSNINRSSIVEESKISGESAQEGNTSLKRKAAAEGLRSLEIPSPIELATIGSLREWLQAGAYATPKFGCYNLPSAVSAKDCSEESIFNPELVAAFEESMQQLEVEEESIIRQIEGNMKLNGTREMEACDEIQS